MKIPNINGIVSIARGQLEQRNPQQAERSSTAQSADKVELSSASQTVQRLASELNTPVQRQALVEQLKADYAAGRLSIDSQATAEAMVAEGLFDDIITGK